LSLTSFGPGKVILLGEHAVVYGAPALAGALQRGVRAVGIPSTDTRLQLPKGLKARMRAQLNEAFEAAAEATGRPAIKVALESDLPISMGLGSSAALSVAVSRLLLRAAGRRDDARSVSGVALQMEQRFHGTPSGVDHACSVAGGLISYRRRPGAASGRAQRLAVHSPLHLAVLLVGERSPTRTTVASLRERKARWPERYERLFREIGRTAVDGHRALAEDDLAGLGDAMNVNHGLLVALGLSSASLDAAVHGLRAQGALGAKLTGAGGDGGAVIGLFERPAQALRAIERSGLPGFSSTLTACGEEQPS